MFFYSFLLIAHLQAIILPISIGFISLNKFKHLNNSSLIPFGFFSIGIASLFELFDHTQTEWIYINHSSIFNWLFYSFLSLGLTLLSISVIKNKNLTYINLIICFLAIISYWLIGKPIALGFQVLVSIILIISWQKKFKDWLFIAYPIFGIFLTTFFGIKLTLTANQLWHVFIGPSGSISVLTFYIVLVNSKNKLKKYKLQNSNHNFHI